MRRLFSLILGVLLLLSCAACAGNGGNAGNGTVSGDAGPVQTDQVAPPDGAGPQVLPDSGLAGVEPPVVQPAEPTGDTPASPTETDGGAAEDEDVERVIDPAKPMVALTFDDGPDSTYTDQIMDIFEEYNALATFFVVGQYVNRYPEVVERMAESGFEVGSHSYAHSQLTKLSVSALKEDMRKADEAIEAATGAAPYLVRPPYGSVNKTVSAVAGRPMICWSVDTEDWKSRDAQTIIDYVENYGDLDGDVILFHSIYESTADAIEVLVPWLQEQGYQLVTVTELMSYYYGEWPQPATTYWGYFSSTPRTEEPLPLPGPGELVAQPVDVPVTPPAPPQPTQPPAPPETPPEDPTPETPPEDPTPETPPEETPAPETPPEETPAPETPPEETPPPETPPEEDPTPETPPVTSEEPVIPPDDNGEDGDAGELPETPPQEGGEDAPSEDEAPQQPDGGAENEDGAVQP